MKYHTLTPAYGAIYTTKREVVKAWVRNKDFRLATTGQYLNRSEANHYLPGDSFEIRYGLRLEKVVILDYEKKPQMKDARPGPRLAKLIESGDAYMNYPNPVYAYGIASDGVTMILGSTGNFEEIENYLKEYPTPEDW